MYFSMANKHYSIFPFLPTGPPLLLALPQANPHLLPPPQPPPSPPSPPTPATALPTRFRGPKSSRFPVYTTSKYLLYIYTMESVPFCI